MVGFNILWVEDVFFVVSPADMLTEAAVGARMVSGSRPMIPPILQKS